MNRARHKGILNTKIFPSRTYSLANDISCTKDDYLYDHKNRLRDFNYCSFDLSVAYNTKSKYQYLLRGTNLLNTYERGVPQRPRMIALTMNAHF